MCNFSITEGKKPDTASEIDYSIRVKNKYQLPPIPEAERTPLVEALLLIIEQQAQTIQKLEEGIQHLRDEVAVLKGEKKRPEFKASKLDKETNPDDGDESDGDDKKPKKRPGSSKRRKTQTLTIHHEETIQPEGILPDNATFKGYRDYTVQDLKISPYNTRYHLAIWETPDGKTYSGRPPSGGHFGGTIKSYILYQYHHCQVTQPLLLEQLREWNIDISSGQINNILLKEKEEEFIQEKEELLSTALEVSDYITVDDSGARHKGKNGYVTHIGNQHFAWFKSTASKSRINFLKLLRAGQTEYHLSDESYLYMTQAKLPNKMLTRLQEHSENIFQDEDSWEAHLDCLGFKRPKHRRIATEGALIGSLLEHGFRQDIVIVSDDAGQFNVFLHALCWVHTERLIHKLIPLNDQHRIEIQMIRDQIWTLYRDLKVYQKSPSSEQKNELDARFDTIFNQKTSYETLNQLLKRINRNKQELLVVLQRPESPLHTNGSETDIRDYVKKKKVSGGTRSDDGRRCRDTFASLKKTCRKLKISFWEFLNDRVSKVNSIPPLAEIVRQKMGNKTA